MSQEGIDLLVRIERRLASIDASLQRLVVQQRATTPQAVASDRDLDGKYGDPIVKFMPRDWTGPSFKGRRMSECPAELLELLARTFDYFGDQAEKNNERTNAGKPVADYKRQDAARARGWAKRIRARGPAETAPADTADGWADGSTTDEPDAEWAEIGDGI